MMDVDLTVALIKATVQIDQPISEAKRMVGTGFLVSVPKPDGTSEVVQVTAALVFEKMPPADVRIGWRVQGVKGNASRHSRKSVAKGERLVSIEVCQAGAFRAMVHNWNDTTDAGRGVFCSLGTRLVPSC